MRCLHQDAQESKFWLDKAHSDSRKSKNVMKFLSNILALSLFASGSAVSCPDFTTADDKFDLQSYMGE